LHIQSYCPWVFDETLEIAETLQGTGFRSAAKEDNGNDISAEMTSVTVQDIKLFVYLLLWRKHFYTVRKEIRLPKYLENIFMKKRNLKM
jgi:hypothetical protein